MILQVAARKQTIAIMIALIGLVMGLTKDSGYAQSTMAIKQATGSTSQAEPAFGNWLKALREEALGKGISETTLDSALSDLKPIRRVIELDRHQPEFTQTFWSYLDRRINDQRINMGRSLLIRHHRLLNAIQGDYAVPSRYLVAFWGLETHFGHYRGDFQVVPALATLAFDRRRSQFFRIQLLDALQIIEKGHIVPQKMTGSWAGAMGHMQFMPSTFLGHAVDRTGDGRIDIWQSLPDAFASAANYLRDMGWEKGKTWGREVRLPRDFDLMEASMQIKKPVKAWSALGVRRADGKPLPESTIEGSLVLPQGHKGPAFLVYENFRVILRWNRSINYAIAVGHLADRMVGLPPILNGRGADHAPLSRAQVKKMQMRLNQLGFNAGSPDGILGPRTKAALRGFQQARELPPDGYPTPLLLKLLSAPEAF